MATTQLVPVEKQTIAPGTMEKVLMEGDLSKLTAVERLSFYRAVCDSVGLNPLTKPFEYIRLNGKLTLYARKDATDQMRKRQKVSIQVVGRELLEEVYTVMTRASLPDGRQDEDIGAVFCGGLKGEARANAFMKAQTKAKRRVTLSICGLGWLDETEVDTVPGTGYVKVDHETGEITEDIRTGGHAPGTQDAANAVLQEKLGQPGAEGPNKTEAGKLITRAQQKRLFAVAKDSGFVDPDGSLDIEAVKTFLIKTFGFPSTSSIPESQYHTVIAAIEGGGMPPEPGKEARAIQS
jgi:hypothetical protein